LGRQPAEVNDEIDIEAVRNQLLARSEEALARLRDVASELYAVHGLTEAEIVDVIRGTVSYEDRVDALAPRRHRRARRAGGPDQPERTEADREPRPG
jgi:hypothetical protein